VSAALAAIALSAALQGPAGSADSLAELRELAELGAPGEVVELWRPRIEPGGAFARSGEARALVARAAFAAGDEALAARLVEGGDAVDDPGALELARAWLALERDRLDEALALLVVPDDPADPPDPDAPRAVSLRRPERPEAWLLLARVLARRGDARAAGPPAERFLALAPLDPGAPTAWHLVGTAALAAREPERARAAFDASARWRRWHDLLRARRIQARLHPDDPAPRLAIARLLFEAGDDAGAAARLEALLADEPPEAAAVEARRLLDAIRERPAAREGER